MPKNTTEGQGASKIVLPEQHDAARRAAKAKQRNTRKPRVEPLFGDTPVHQLTLADKRERAEKRNAGVRADIERLEDLIRTGKIGEDRMPAVQAALTKLRERAGTKRF